MYFMLIYFYLLLSGNKFTVSLYLLIFVDPPRIVNHKGKQNSEKIQSQDKTQFQSKRHKYDC